MDKYQCNSCGRAYDTKREAARCHPGANVQDDIPKARREAVCPSCGKTYQMGYTGVVAGCDKCQGITRRDNGYVWRY